MLKFLNYRWLCYYSRQLYNIMPGTERERLFDRVALENEARVPNRPLGGISDFVVGDFPALLRDVSSGEKHIATVSRVVGERLLAGKDYLQPMVEGKIDTPSLKLARLDLLILESGIFQLGGEPPASLSTLVELVSQDLGMPPSPTYEDMVLTNPRGDIRTFTKGYAGRSEADFWIGHARIEDILEKNSQDITALLENDQNQVVGGAIEIITQVRERFHLAKKITAQIGFLMPKEHFTGEGFRRFVMPHPVRGLEGPSGAHSAQVPINEALIAGEKVPQHARQRVHNKLVYFPQKSQSTLLTMYDRADQGVSLRQLVMANHNFPEVVTAFNSMVDGLVNFRKMHLMVVAHQLPDVFSGKGPGTSGEGNVQEFLQRFINNDMKIY